MFSAHKNMLCSCPKCTLQLLFLIIYYGAEALWPFIKTQTQNAYKTKVQEEIKYNLPINLPTF